mgnify:CR=1 FL=1
MDRHALLHDQYLRHLCAGLKEHPPSAAICQDFSSGHSNVSEISIHQEMYLAHARAHTRNNATTTIAAADPSRRITRRLSAPLSPASGDDLRTDSFSALNPSTSPTEATYHASNSNEDLIGGVVFMFLSGIGLIVGLVILVYSVVPVYNRLRGRNQRPDEDEHPGPTAETYGPVAFKAKLWGLTPDERKAILQILFAEHSTNYSSNNFSGEIFEVGTPLDGAGNANLVPNLNLSSSLASDRSTTGVSSDQASTDGQEEPDPTDQTVLDSSMLMIDDEAHPATVCCSICLETYGTFTTFASPHRSSITFFPDYSIDLRDVSPSLFLNFRRRG